jgi:hypothetical protein
MFDPVLRLIAGPLAGYDEPWDNNTSTGGISVTSGDGKTRTDVIDADSAEGDCGEPEKSLQQHQLDGKGEQVVERTVLTGMVAPLQLSVRGFPMWVKDPT